MSEQEFDRVNTTLGSSYTAGGTSLVLAVSLASLGVTITGTTHVLVSAEGSNTAEIFKVTAGSGSTLTVVGAQGTPATTASNHASGARVTFVLTVEGLATMAMFGDVTGPANATTIYSLAAAVVAVTAITGAFVYTSGGTPSIRQTPATATTSTSGSPGTTMTIQAQDGQGTTKGGADGGNGAILWLAGGNPGSKGDGGQPGLPGPVILGNGDSGVLELLNSTTFEPLASNTLSLGTSSNQFYDVGSSNLSVYSDAGSGNVGTMRMGMVPLWYAPGSATQQMMCVQMNAASGSYIGIGSDSDMMLCDNSSELYIADSAGHLGFDINVGTSSTNIGTLLHLTPTNNSQINSNQNMVIDYPVLATAGSANGLVGGNFTLSPQPGEPCSGSGHTCGAGGNLQLQFVAGGTASSSATAGAVGSVQILNQAGTVIESWGATHYMTPISVTVAASGTTTLSAAQLQYTSWTASTVTLTGAATIAFGNNKVTGILNLAGITFSGQTLTFSCGTGTDTRTSMTHPLLTVTCDGSNHIYTGGQ